MFLNFFCCFCFLKSIKIFLNERTDHKQEFFTYIFFNIQLAENEEEKNENKQQEEKVKKMYKEKKRKKEYIIQKKIL